MPLSIGGEAWLENVHIPEFFQGSWTNHLTRHKRKLLLNRNEIDRLTGKVRESGLTLVLLSLYFKDGRAKVEIALAKGKKDYDKRHTIRARDESRDLMRDLGKMSI